jgi:hypothetical protein
MKPQLLIDAIWAAGAVQLAIIAANLPLPEMLEVRERFSGLPRFLCQIFYVHWIYIVIILAMFAALCFSFAPQLAGGSSLGRFLSGFMCWFWLLRICLQVFYYDREIRRRNRVLDSLYLIALAALVLVFGVAAARPMRWPMR